MSSDKNSEKLSLESTLSREQAACYLDSLAQSLRDGTITVENGLERVSLTPTDELNCEIKAKQKGPKAEVAVKFKWMQPAAPATETTVASGSDAE